MKVVKINLMTSQNLKVKNQFIKYQTKQLIDQSYKSPIT